MLADVLSRAALVVSVKTEKKSKRPQCVSHLFLQEIHPTNSSVNKTGLTKDLQRQRKNFSSNCYPDDASGVEGWILGPIAASSFRAAIALPSSISLSFTTQNHFCVDFFSPIIRSHILYTVTRNNNRPLMHQEIHQGRQHPLQTSRRS